MAPLVRKGTLMRQVNADGTFADRIALLIEGRSVNSFASECGISEGSIRQYLGGAIPRMDKAVRIARTAGVRLEWLAAGEAPMYPDSSANAVAALIDTAMLTRILCDVVLAVFRGCDPKKGEEIGRIVADIYNTVTKLNLETDAENAAALRYAIEQLRSSMHSPNGHIKPR